MITEINLSIKLESLRPLSDSAISTRIHELLLDMESDSENFFGKDSDDYALLMPDIEVESEQV